MKYPNVWDKYCKLVLVPSFSMEMAFSVGPNQTALVRMTFDQGMHCLIWPVCLTVCLGLSWLHATLLLLLLFYYYLLITMYT